MPEPDPAVSSPPPAAPPPAPPTTGEPARGPDPRDQGPPVPVSLGGHALGDLGHPRVDARLLQALLLRDGEVARWRDRADWTTRQLSPSSRGPGGRWSPAASDGSQTTPLTRGHFWFARDAAFASWQMQPSHSARGSSRRRAANTLVAWMETTHSPRW